MINFPRWVKWSEKGSCFITTDYSTANGIVSSDRSQVYHIAGKPEFQNYNLDYKTVTVTRISEEEYLSLQIILATKTPASEGEEIMLQQLIERRIEDFSSACQERIIRGFDIILSDGETHHFSMELPDQIKISKLNDKALAGETFLPYHADDEPCKVYSAEDINAIYSAAERLVEYETTYFNSLKIYIRSMIDRNDVNNLRYGDEIPEEYQTDVLKMMLADIQQ